MEPGHEDREYPRQQHHHRPLHQASMEPGHEDREYQQYADKAKFIYELPQWSPVMKTGNTVAELDQVERERRASMEPGHEDREYRKRTHHVPIRLPPQWSPVMKTGNTREETRFSGMGTSLNGARS